MTDITKEDFVEQEFDLDSCEGGYRLYLEDDEAMIKILRDQEIANHVRDVGEDNAEIVDRQFFKELEEKAKKWENSWSNPMNEQYKDVQEAFQIVSRLKERKGHLCIGERGCTDCYLDSEIQKILEGKE